MIAVSPIIAESAPGIIAMGLAIGGWFVAKHAHNLGQQRSK